MKKIFFLIIIFLNFTNVFSEEKIYYLDVDFLLNNTNQGKIIINQLKDINTKNINDLKIKEEELKSLEKEISNVKNIISREELEKRIENLKKKIDLYKLEKNKKTQEFNNFRNKEIKFFFENITPHIEEFMKINSIGVIFDKKNIFIAHSKYDITNDIINFLNEKNK
jgi:outer membrane protein